MEGRQTGERLKLHAIGLELELSGRESTDPRFNSQYMPHLTKTKQKPVHKLYLGN